MSATTRKSLAVGKAAAKSKPRVLYFDILRAFAPILVVVVHAACRFNGDIWASDTKWAFVIRSICQIAVPAFIMVSGALFLDPKRRFDWKKHFRKYVLRLLLLYVFWAVLYAVLDCVFAKGISTEQRIHNLFAELFGLHHYHLWFILMLLGMYLLVPCLRKITESRALTEYFLVLGIIFCFALPGLAECLGLAKTQLTGANPALIGTFDGMRNLFSYFAAKLCLRFVVYFVLGYYLHAFGVPKFWRKFIYILGVLGLIYAIVVGIWRMRVTGVYNTGAEVENINIGVLCYGVAVFTLVKQLFGRAKRLPKLIGFMAKHSLGVYLIHVAFVDFILYRIIRAGSQPLWILLFCSVLIYIASLLCAWIISKLPLLRKVVQ